MAGTLRMARGTRKPQVGDIVYIVVGASNYPTGFWEGKLVSVGQDYTQPHNEDEAHACEAVITDPRAKNVSGSNWVDREPHVNYDVLEGHGAVAYLQRCREEDRKEIEALRTKIRTVHETYESMMRAIVSAEGLKGFKDLLEDFFKRLGR